MNKDTLLSKFEKIRGHSSNLFCNEEWREFDAFEQGYNLAEKESETERQYFLDKEATDLRTNTEIINSKYSVEEVLDLLFRANKKAPDFGWRKENLEDWFNTIKK